MASHQNRYLRRSAGTGIASQVVYSLQRRADRQGHGNATHGAGVGGLLGGVLGSFFGPIGALVGGGLGACLGAAIGGTGDR